MWKKQVKANVEKGKFTQNVMEDKTWLLNVK